MKVIKYIFIKSKLKRKDLKIYELVVPDKVKEVKKKLKKTEAFLSEHKTLLTLLITVGTLIISACMYLYRQGYLAYFNIGNEWNKYTDTSLFFLLVKPLCIAIITIMIVFYYSLPFLFDKNVFGKTIYGLLSIVIDCFIILFSQVKERDGVLLALIIKFILPLTGLVFFDWAKAEKEKKNPRKTERFEAIGAYTIVFVFSFALGYILYKRIQTVKQFLFSSLSLLLLVEILEALLIIVCCLCYSNINNQNKCTAKIDNKSNGIKSDLLLILFATACGGCLMNSVGKQVAEMTRTFPVIYINGNVRTGETALEEDGSFPQELNGLALPSANAVHQINEILTTTATTGTTVLQSSATTVTTTTVQTSAADTSQEETPEPVIVYVVLAENKDCYLTSIGKIEAGGILHIDSSVEYTLEKKNQITLKKKFQDVKLDYTYSKEVTP